MVPSLIRGASCLLLVQLAHGSEVAAMEDPSAHYDLSSALTKPIADAPETPEAGQTASHADDMDLGVCAIAPLAGEAPIPLWPSAGRLSGKADWLRIYGRQRHLPAPPPTSFFQLVAPNYLQRPNYIFHVSSDWHSWATLGAGFTQLF